MLEILNQHSWLLLTSLLLFGLVVGSFLNVVIYRLPLMMESRWRGDCCQLLEIENEADSDTPLTLATPNSHCPGCKQPIRPWQNIPIFSYLLLGGKCANCGIGISLRYPTVEFVFSSFARTVRRGRSHLVSNHSHHDRCRSSIATRRYHPPPNVAGAATQCFWNLR